MDENGLDKGNTIKSLYNGEKWQGVPRLENRFAGARSPQSCGGKVAGAKSPQYKLREVGRYMYVTLKICQFYLKDNGKAQ